MVHAFEPVLDALGDPTRRAILERLRGGEKPVVDIARGLSVGRPAVSLHLRVLKDAGLVTDRAEGTRRYYAIDHRGLEALRIYLTRFWVNALTNFVDVAEGRDTGRGERGRTRDRAASAHRARRPPRR